MQTLQRFHQKAIVHAWMQQLANRVLGRDPANKPTGLPAPCTLQHRSVVVVVTQFLPAKGLYTYTLSICSTTSVWLVKAEAGFVEQQAHPSQLHNLLGMQTWPAENQLRSSRCYTAACKVYTSTLY